MWNAELVQGVEKQVAERPAPGGAGRAGELAQGRGVEAVHESLGGSIDRTVRVGPVRIHGAARRSVVQAVPG